MLLNNLLVERAEKTTLQPANPIKPKDSPIRAINVWERIDGSLKRIFKFDSVEERNRFVIRVISYEEEKGHTGTLLVRENSVSISVTTRDLKKITELDKEYSRDVELIYLEIVNG